MSIGSALMGFLTSLPDIIKLIQSFMTWINHVSGNDPAGFITKVGNAMSTLNSAQTEQERQNAAKALADAIRNIG
jgi:hypothetical protein